LVREESLERAFTRQDPAAALFERRELHSPDQQLGEDRPSVFRIGLEEHPPLARESEELCANAARIHYAGPW
jgi:hypothetical protein